MIEASAFSPIGGGSGMASGKSGMGTVLLGRASSGDAALAGGLMAAGTLVPVLECEGRIPLDCSSGMYIQP